jgi:hypothetical protein
MWSICKVSKKGHRHHKDHDKIIPSWD